MILSIETALHNIAHMLRERIAPAVDDKFAAETARLAEMLLSLNAGWVDDAAAVRVSENARIRTLFVQAGALVLDARLAGRLAEAAVSRDPGLKISELDAESNRLRGLLTELHVHVDAREDEEVRAFNQRIWRDLREFEVARGPR